MPSSWLTDMQNGSISVPWAPLGGELNNNWGTQLRFLGALPASFDRACVVLIAAFEREAMRGSSFGGLGGLATRLACRWAPVPLTGVGFSGRRVGVPCQGNAAGMRCQAVVIAVAHRQV